MLINFFQSSSFVWFRGTHGTCFTTTLGAALHELCHTFDLAHTQDGIMSRGFDNIHKFFVVTTTNTVEDPIEIKSKSAQPSLLVRAVSNSNCVIRNQNCVQTNHFRKKSEDETYFTRNCSVILYYHK